MAFYPIKGEVSSVNSLLTTPDQIKSFNHLNDILLFLGACERECPDET